MKNCTISLLLSYGYGGPLYDLMNEQVMKDFRKEFEEFC